MKRLFSILLVAVLLIGCMTVAAMADTVATVTGADVTTTAGSTVAVTFTVSNVTYQDYALKLDYDSDLTVAGVEAGSASHGGFGRVGDKIATYDYQEVTTSGTLFTVSFKVPADAAVGTVYDVSVKDVTFINQADETLSIGVDAGSITIVAPECTEHQYGDWYTVDEADCENGGSERRDCANCDHYETRDTDPLGHDLPAEWTTVEAADCENGGSERRDCSRCDHFETRDTDPLGHAWGEWEIVDEATCTKDGLKKRVCATCGEVEEQVIPSEEGHAWGDWETVKKDTCTENGLKKRVCGSCGEVQEDVIQATGHVIDEDWEYDSKGHWHICTKCGEKFDHDDHDLKELKNDKGQTYKKCSVCPYATNPEGDVIDDVPKTGDITPMITTGILVLIAMICTAVIVFKRKRAN